MKYLLDFRPNSSIHNVSAMLQLTTIKLDFNCNDWKIFCKKIFCTYLPNIFGCMLNQTNICLGMALQYNIWKNLGIICNYYCCKLKSNQTKEIRFPAKIATGTAFMPGAGISSAAPAAALWFQSEK